MAATDDTKLEILHDHYKESFSYIREWEEKRDRLFMFVIAMIGILFLEIQYSDLFSGILGSIKLEFVELNISLMPISVFLSITWTYLFTIVLRYCQHSILIERQYDYLHSLESKISKFFGGRDIYCRESRAYLNKYPLFSELAWIYYSFLFPAIVIMSVWLAIYFEWNKIWGPLYHLIYDLSLSIAVITYLIFYRFYPLGKKLVLKVKDRISSTFRME